MTATCITIKQTQTMKSKFDFLIPLAVVLLVGLSCSTYHLYKERKAYKEKAERLEKSVSQIGQARQERKELHTDNGTLSSVTTEPIQVTSKNIRERYAADVQVVKDAGIKGRDIDELTHINISTRDSVSAEVQHIDSTTMHVHYADGYARIDVQIDTLRTAAIDYEIKDSVVVVAYQKRHRLLFGLIRWKETERVEVHSKNPKAEVESVEVVQRMTND